MTMKYSNPEPNEEVGGAAVTLFTPSAVSWALNSGVGWPGITVVKSLPSVRVPVTVVFVPLLLLPNLTSLTL